MFHFLLLYEFMYNMNEDVGKFLTQQRRHSKKKKKVNAWAFGLISERRSGNNFSALLTPSYLSSKK